MKYKRIFFDANILIDLFDKNRLYNKESHYIKDYCLKNNIIIYTSCDILTNLYYINSKYIDKNIALDSVELVNKTIKILSFENDTIQQVVNLMKKDSDYADFEDCLQYILAKNSNCEAIITNDKNFVSKDISLFSSKNFAKELM